MSSQTTYRDALVPTRAEAPGTTGASESSRWERLTRGRGTVLGLLGLLGATAVLYLWSLSESGYANSFYAAAAQAGSVSWKAFFFGSSDAANSITVDKSPFALWPMDLSVRIFGLSSWSVLVPQALEGVAGVGLLWATVRRATGSARAGLLAGAVMALTPVAVLMFRFDNPDSMLVLLMIGSAYAVQRALESTWSIPGLASGLAESRPARRAALLWISFAGALVGLAFLTKMLQAFLVLPALGLAYLVFATLPFWTRVGHLLVGTAVMVVAGGWWFAAVELWPASSRPYIGGSQHNSILELVIGYNGLGRLDGSETGSVGGGGGTTSMWGATGVFRMFGSEVGGQVAWLIPAAVILAVAGLMVGRRVRSLPGAPATPEGRPARAMLTLWLAWLVVTAGTFSFMAGIFHAYYTVALAPAIGALVAIGATVLWRRRDSLVASGLLALTTAFTAAFAFMLLERTGDWHPWLRYAVVVLGFAAALMIAGVRHLPRRVGQVVAVAALVSMLAGPAAYALDTASTAHTGSIPSAGPSAGGGFGGGFGGGMPRGFGGGRPTGSHTFVPGGGTVGGTGTGGQTGNAGGLLDASTSTAAINTLLESDAGSFTWVAAAVGSNSASGYQLATQLPVMAIGGFNGSDPSPTLAQFEKYVANGQIHYFIGGGTGGFGQQNGGSNASSEIASWVESHFTATTVSGVTVYDLSSGVK